MNALSRLYRRPNTSNASVKDVNRTSYRTEFEVYSQHCKITCTLCIPKAFNMLFEVKDKLLTILYTGC